MFAQEIADKEDVIYDMSSNLNFGAEVIIFYCLSLIITWLFCLLLNKLIAKSNESSRLETNARSETDSRPKKDLFLDVFVQREITKRARIILPFLSLFFWMTILFVMNNIKTNKARETSFLIVCPLFLAH